LAASVYCKADRQFPYRLASRARAPFSLPLQCFDLAVDIDGVGAHHLQQAFGRDVGLGPLVAVPRVDDRRVEGGAALRSFAHCQLLDCCRLNMLARSALRRLHH
jgi:hypothetical protein